MKKGKHFLVIQSPDRANTHTNIEDAEDHLRYLADMGPNDEVCLYELKKVLRRTTSVSIEEVELVEGGTAGEAIQDMARDNGDINLDRNVEMRINRALDEVPIGAGMIAPRQR